MLDTLAFQCPKFLRQTFVEWAAETIPRSFWRVLIIASNATWGARIKLRFVRWLSSGFEFSFVAGRPHTYDESTYLNSLRRRGSPLLNSIWEAAKITDCRPQGVGWAGFSKLQIHQSNPCKQNNRK